MALTVTVTPGKQFASNERVTIPKLNQLGQPTFAVTGTVSTTELADDSVTGAKTTPSDHFYTSSVTFSAGIYTLTFSPTPTVIDGMIIAFKTNTGNTTDATNGTRLTIGASTKKLLKNRTELLLSGDLVTNQIVEARFDSAGDGGAGAWQMLSQTGSVPDYYTANATGTNDYTVTLTPPVSHGVSIGDLEGKPIRFKVPNTNTGACRLTVQIGGVTLPQKRLRKFNNTEMVGGDLTQFQIAEVVYEATSDGYQLQSLPGSPLREVTIVTLARDLIIKNNSVSSKIDLQANDIVLRDNNNRHFLAQGVVLTADLSGGVNTVNGTDNAAAAGWWYMWVIYNGTTVASVLSTSSTAPTLVGGLVSYTFKALMGAVFATSGTTFGQMYQAGAEVWLDAGAAANLVFTAKTGTTSYAVLSGADLTQFRNIVPPLARSFSGTIGNVTNVNGGMEIAACKDDGTADASLAIGAQQVTAASSGTALDSYFVAAPFKNVPLRGGTGNYNFQWRSMNASAIYRLVITGYSV